jgi:hypothetical protein
MIWDFIDVFKRVNRDQIRDDDYADRLSHRYTVTILIVFFLVISSTQFVGNPISCWTPPHFTDSMNTYTHRICFIASTYYVPTAEKLPNPSDPRTLINYYQWMPFILAFMTFLFYVPWTILHMLSSSSVVQSKQIIKLINAMDQSDAKSREDTISRVVCLLDQSVHNMRDWYDYTFCGRFRRMITRCFLPVYKRNGSYMCTIYMFVKFLYLANVCGQFFLLNSFMGPEFNVYGFHVLRDLWQGQDFWESPRFPRVTMCDFTTRAMGENNHRNTIQCTLPINLYNEKIFMFLWFWFFFVAALTAYNFIVWLSNFTSASRTSFVRRYLHRTSEHSEAKNDSKGFHGFVCDYLRQDGVFLLRIIKKNTNDLVIGELICALWDNYDRYPKFLKEKSDGSEQQEKLNGNFFETLTTR